MANKPTTQSRSRTVRVPDTVWEQANAKAAAAGETVSDVIRRALARYVNRR